MALARLSRKAPARYGGDHLLMSRAMPMPTALPAATGSTEARFSGTVDASIIPGEP